MWFGTHCLSYITDDGFPKTEAEKLLFNAQYLQIILLLFNTSVHVGINIRQA